MWQDGFSNILNNLGTKRDKQQHYKYSNVLFSRQQLDELYNDAFIEKIVNIIPFYMTKDFIKIKEVNSEEIYDFYDKVQIRNKLNDMFCMLRLYGGGLAFLGINDGSSDLASPLNFDNIKEFNYINLIPRYEVSRVEYNLDPTQEEYLSPTHFYIRDKKVHKSRTLFVNAKKEFLTTNSDWGNSVVAKVFPYFIFYYSAIANTSQLFEDAKLDIYKMKDLALMLDDSTDFFKKWSIANEQKSILNSLIIDSEEEHSRIQTNFSNMDNIIDKLQTLMSAAVDVPRTILFGEQQKGISNEMSGDLEIFYNKITAIQEKDMTTHIDYLNKIISHLLYKKDTNIQWEFNSLWNMDELKQQEINKTESETLQAYVTNGIIEENEAREIIRFKYNLQGDIAIQPQEEISEEEITPKQQQDTIVDIIEQEKHYSMSLYNKVKDYLKGKANE